MLLPVDGDTVDIERVKEMVDKYMQSGMNKNKVHKKVFIT